MIPNIFQHEFKILNGMPAYIFFEQNDSELIKGDEFNDKVAMLIEFAREKQLNRVGFLFYKNTEKYNTYEKIMLANEFTPFAEKIEVRKKLLSLPAKNFNFEWKSVSDSHVTEDEFAELWTRCMMYTGNTHSTLTINEHIDSLKSELQASWKSSCFVAYNGRDPIGISIPHLEPGTRDEGRLFYFGILPDKRGQGLAKQMHADSLYLLKNLGAGYYVGSTHETNTRMRRVFKSNGCTLTAKTVSFYYYF